MKPKNKNFNMKSYILSLIAISLVFACQNPKKSTPPAEPFFKLSLAQWSFNKSFRSKLRDHGCNESLVSLHEDAHQRSSSDLTIILYFDFLLETGNVFLIKIFVVFIFLLGLLLLFCLFNASE